MRCSSGSAGPPGDDASHPSSNAKEVVVNVYELSLDGVESERRLHAARWELFVFPEIREVCRIGGAGRVGILYEGDEPNAEAWLDALAAAGFVRALAA
jgi:hypothetical protein